MSGDIWKQSPIMKQMNQTISGIANSWAQQNSKRFAGYVSQINSVMNATTISQAVGAQKAIGELISSMSVLTNLTLPVIDPAIFKQFDASQYVAGLDQSLKLIGSSQVSQLGKAASELAKSFSDFGALPGIQDFSNSLKPIIESFQALQKWQPRYWYPENLKNVSAEFTLVDILHIEHEEGISLFYVASTVLIDKLLTAKSPEDRLEILDVALESIIENCRQILQEHRCTKRQKEYSDYLEESLEVIEEGHLAAGEALLADLTESFTNDLDDEQLQQDLRNQKNHVKFEDKMALQGQSIRGEVALGAVPAAFIRYYPGETIPVDFSRHAIAHSMPKKQFSRVNASKALLMVFGFATYLFGWDLKI